MVQKDDTGNVSLIEHRTVRRRDVPWDRRRRVDRFARRCTGRGGRGGYRGDDRTQRRCRDAGFIQNRPQVPDGMRPGMTAIIVEAD